MLRTAFSIPLLVFSLSAAHAEPLLPPEPEPEEQARLMLARELTRESLNASEQAIPEPQSWRRIHLSKGAGFEMRRELQLGERDVVFGVKGPVMKRKRFGLSFELRF